MISQGTVYTPQTPASVEPARNYVIGVNPAKESEEKFAPSCSSI